MYRKLTRKEELDYFINYYEGDIDAYHILIKSQIPWGKRLAIRYCEKHHWRDIDAAISAAYLGIIRSVQKFEPIKGCRLITYSRHWIFESLTRLHKLERSIIFVPEYLGNPCEKHNLLQQYAQGARTVRRTFPEFLPTKETTTSEPDIKIYQYVVRLPQRYKEIVIARYWHERTYRDIASMYGISHERVRQILIISIRKLREMLLEECENV